jgi:hypothetical protein
MRVALMAFGYPEQNARGVMDLDQLILELSLITDPR